jgi:hypothetical protein
LVFNDLNGAKRLNCLNGLSDSRHKHAHGFIHPLSLYLSTLEILKEMTMKKMISIVPISLLAFTLFVTATPAASQETSGQILARLEKLSAENRQKILVERARSEREVTFYSSLQTSDSEPFVKQSTPALLEKESFLADPTL